MPISPGWPPPDPPYRVLSFAEQDEVTRDDVVALWLREGTLPEPEARSRFFLIDRPGLLHDGLAGLRPFQQRFSQPKDRVIGWRPAEERPRKVSTALKAYAHFATSAAKGAVRVVD